VSPTTADGDGARDVLQVVGTCALDDLDRYAPAFAEVVESVRPTRPWLAPSQRRTGE
jgi:hypothetical protein